LYPSQWYELAALLWFPWTFSTAQLLLVFGSVRGALQEVVNGWAAHNLFSLWLTPLGLATVFYFVPKLTNRPLYSRHYALFTFWSVMLLGSWCGIPGTAPVPAWIPTLSSAITVLTVLTVLTVMINLHQTLGGRYSTLKGNVTLQFIGFGIGAFAVSALMNILSVLPEVNRLTQLTWFTRAAFQLNTYGFFAMTLFGAIYYISPRVTGLEWPLPKLISAHFWCVAGGIALLVLPLAIGGIIEGVKLNNPALPFADIMKTTKHFLRVSTIGDLLLALGNALFAANLVAMAVRYYRTHVVPVYQAVTTPLKPAEVQP
jgi:cytochrome c oxidase cbb3-type subunit 1